MKRSLWLVALISLACSGNYSMPVSPNINIGNSGHAPGLNPEVPTSTQLIVPILAHYVNWHDQAGLQTSATIMPLRGNGKGYDSYSLEIIRQHNEEMSANGIVPLISWWGPEGSANQGTGDLFLDRYLQVQSSVKFGILYEVTGRLTEKNGRFDFDDPINANQFLEDMVHLNTKYFSRYPDRVYRINDRPVVFIWLSHAFKGHFDKTAIEAKAKTNIYLIGSDFNVFSSFRSDLLNTIRGLDAVSSYGIYASNLAVQYNGHVSQDFVSQYMKSVANWSLWLSRNAPEVKLILPVQFTYDDSRTRKGNMPMAGTTKEEADYFAGSIHQTIENAFQNCKNILPYVLLVSYNEHYEGSSVEPTDLYGSDFLDVVREKFFKPTQISGSQCVVAK